MALLLTIAIVVVLSTGPVKAAKGKDAAKADTAGAPKNDQSIPCHTDKVDAANLVVKLKALGQDSLTICLNNRVEVILRSGLCSLVQNLVFGVQDLQILGYNLFVNLLPSGYSQCVRGCFTNNLNDKAIAELMRKLTGLPPDQLTPAKIFKCLKMDIGEVVLPLLGKLAFAGEFIRRIFTEEAATTDEKNPTVPEFKEPEKGEKGGVRQWLANAGVGTADYLWQSFDTRNALVLASGGPSGWVSFKLCGEFYSKVAFTTKQLTDWFTSSEGKLADLKSTAKTFPDIAAKATNFFGDSKVINGIVEDLAAGFKEAKKGGTITIMK